MGEDARVKSSPATEETRKVVVTAAPRWRPRGASPARHPAAKALQEGPSGGVCAGRAPVQNVVVARAWVAVRPGTNCRAKADQRPRPSTFTPRRKASCSSVDQGRGLAREDLLTPGMRRRRPRQLVPQPKQPPPTTERTPGVPKRAPTRRNAPALVSQSRAEVPAE